jgi:hypothetical protein
MIGPSDATFFTASATNLAGPPASRCGSAGCPSSFYVVHFYVLGIAAAAVHTKWGLAATYLIWLLLLVLMLWPCAWYYRMKRDRPNWVTRFF